MEHATPQRHDGDYAATDVSAASKSEPTTLVLYRRLFQGRKHFFSPPGDPASNEPAAKYYIVNPVPHKNTAAWWPVFYRGDNPKHTPTSTAIGRARRAWMWRGFRLWLGDGMREVRENESRARKKFWALWRTKWRRRFRMKEKPELLEGLEEQQEVKGLVMLVNIRRKRFLSRKVEFEIEGVKYRWSGTRVFSKGRMKKVKGWSHSMKLIRVSDHAVVATFEKGRWVTFSKAVKTGSVPNKQKQKVGTLQIYEEVLKSPPTVTVNTKHVEDLSPEILKEGKESTQKSTKKEKKKKEDKSKKILNPTGPHSGDLTEEALVLTCWMVIEGEHRLRWKIVDFLEEVAENFHG